MDQAVTDDSHAVSVGARLRDIRVGRRLTLREVAARAEISEGFLSQIELGRNSPSLKTFRRIAAALGINPADALEEVESSLPRLVPRNNGRVLEIGAVSKFRISPSSMTSIEVLKGEIAVGGDAGETLTHGDSDEVLIVLSGRVASIVGDTEYELAQGDSLCYRSSTPHTIRNIGDQVAEVFWITSPPT